MSYGLNPLQQSMGSCLWFLWSIDDAFRWPMVMHSIWWPARGKISRYAAWVIGGYIDGFVLTLHEYNAKPFLHQIISLYGQDGEWINHRLPTYALMDNKPKNGYEPECRRWTKWCNDSSKNNNSKRRRSYRWLGQKWTATWNKNFVEPWIFGNCRACSDSYFASVGAAAELLKLRTWFYGIKTLLQGTILCNCLKTLSYHREKIVLYLYPGTLMEHHIYLHLHG